MSRRVEVVAPDGIGEVEPGDDLVALLLTALGPDVLRDGDVVVVTSKVVSKAEGRRVGAADREGAITAETVRVVARREHPGGVLRVVENRLGLVMAAAGVDASNTPEGTVLLLPEDPDASARHMRAALLARTGRTVGVLVTDTAGRPWRAGLTDMAIGAAGVRVLDDLRGGRDAHGRELSVTVTAVADELAAASELVRGKADGRPFAVVRGLGHLVTEDDGPGARSLVRAAEADLFRTGSAEAWAEGYAAGLVEGGRGPELVRGEGPRATSARAVTVPAVSWTVVVPLRLPGKGRLLGALPEDRHARLARAFATDTLAACAWLPEVTRLVVVTADDVDRPDDLGPDRWRVVADPGDGLDAAVRAGAAHAADGSAVAVLLADHPALRAAELRLALARAAMLPRALLADADGTGTALLTALPGIDLDPGFGETSARAHRARGHVPIADDRLPGLRRDVDLPEHLAAALALGVGPATAAALAGVSD